VGTLSFFDLNGNLIETRQLTYQANTTARLIYPGATVDANGNPTDWPGWVFTGGFWVPDPTDAAWRNGLSLRYTIGTETATAQVTYPPETATCSANPPTPNQTGTTTTTTVPGSTTTVPGGTTTLPGSTTTIPAGGVPTTTIPGGANIPPTPGSPTPAGIPPTPGTPGPGLPTTGSNVGDVITLALLAAVVGGALLLIARRRREA